MSGKYAGVEKAQMREATSPNRRLSRILDLCSPEVGSTKFFLETGVADENTKFTIIEQEKSSVPIICNKFKNLGLNQPEVFNGRIQDCRFLGPFDLVNLDTCSTPSEPILNWISRLNILKGGELNLWVTAFRNSGLWRETLLNAFLYNNKSGAVVMNQLAEKFSFPRNVTVEQKCVYGALAAALSFYDFDVVLPKVQNRPPGQYRDNRNTMYVYRFVNMKLLKNPARPSLAQILSEIRPTEYFPVIRKKSDGNAKGEKITTSQLILNALTGQPGKKATATFKIRKILSDAKYLHHSDKMVKAGWKAQITKLVSDPMLVKKVHSYIDAF